MTRRRFPYYLPYILTYWLNLTAIREESLDELEKDELQAKFIAGVISPPYGHCIHVSGTVCQIK